MSQDTLRTNTNIVIYSAYLQRLRGYATGTILTIKLVVIIDPQVGGVALRVELINLLSCEKEVLIENQLKSLA